MSPMSDFSKLQLAAPISRAIEEMGYKTMTPIQAQAIPVVLQGRDVMGAAQTGTGKTAAFALPLLQRLLPYESTSTSPARHPVRALVLLPTRELADQVAVQVKQFGKYTQLRSAVVFGGMDMRPQTAELKKGVEVLIATPGRLLDHIESKNVILNQVEYVVLDEADRMLDIGFLPDLTRILSYLPKSRTTLLFSATFSADIKKLASGYLSEPTVIEVAPPNQTAATIEQTFYSVYEGDKLRALVQLLGEKARTATQAFVFVNSKLGCARLARSLEREGLKAVALHGDKSQEERLKALEAFKKGEVQLLVATDVAARGLDIKNVPAVFNYDIPFNAEDYVHRIGRTGRAGASGEAISFVAGDNDKSEKLISEIEKLTQQKIELQALELESNLPDIRRQGHFNTGRRVWERGDDEVGDARPGRGRTGGGGGERSSASRPRPVAAALDPFFTKPYEEPSRSPADQQAEQAASSVTAPRRGLSSNIKSKRNVAALFK